MKKLNLGCGANILPGWINVDNYKLPKSKNKDFVQADIRNLPFKDNFADYIIMDQVLEHFGFKEIPAVLFEVRRVLKKGGKCVIIVPDFADAARQWLTIDHNNHFDPYVFHYLSEVIYGNQMHEGEYHKTAMSAGFLNYVCNMVGLTNTTFTIHPAGGKIPNIDGVRYSDDARLRNAQIVAEIIK